MYWIILAVLIVLMMTLVMFFILNSKINTLMGNQAEAAAELVLIKTQLTKAVTEIQAKIQALEDAVNNPDQDVSPELQAAVDDLKGLSQTLDDIVPDAPPA